LFTSRAAVGSEIQWQRVIEEHRREIDGGNG
jgi:hypothetical protein